MLADAEWRSGGASVHALAQGASALALGRRRARRPAPLRKRVYRIKDETQKRFERDMAKIIGLIDAPPFAVRDQSRIAKF